MKNISKFGVYGVAAGLVAFIVGCGTEKITVDYVMPAKAVTDVSKVNIAAIKVKANVTGNLAGDNKQNAGLVKQLLAMRLYKEGYYQVADDIWANPDCAQEFCDALKEQGASGYSGFIAKGQTKGKVVIDITLDLVLDCKPVKKELPFTLATVPYKAKTVEGVPTSEPDAKATTTEKVKREVTVYETVAKGTLKAKFAGVDGKACPQKYENTFQIAMPKADCYDSAKPSQMKALAAAVTPAVDGIVADISPYKESRELEAIEGGDERVVYLLNAKAFWEVESVVEKLEVTGKANFADFENLGIAREAMGAFDQAKFAYEKAAKLNPESETARAGLKRVRDALAGKDAVKASSARAVKGTKFSSDGASNAQENLK